VWGVNDGTLPLWQRLSMMILFPAIRAWVRYGFKLRPGSHERIVKLIEEFLGELEQQLSDGRRTLLGGRKSVSWTSP